MTQDTHTASGTAIDRALDSFERRERGIPQARIAAELVAELRAALASAAAPAQQPGAAYAELPDALEALQLKSCPCGATPTALQITGDEQAKWAHVSGNCCGEWEIEYRNNYTKLASTEAMTLAAAAWNEAPRASHGQAPAQAAPAYKDSTPELHVGDSAFESWYSTYSPVHKSDKQRARDAYAAGMGDPLVMVAPAAVAGPLNELEELNLLNKLVELGAKAAHAHAQSNSDDGHKGTAAYVQWQEMRAEMGELIRSAYAAPTTQPTTWTEGVQAVAAMLAKKADDFAMEHGHDDMGGLSFGSGAHAEAKMDWHSGLLELEEEVRAMLDRVYPMVGDEEESDLGDWQDGASKPTQDGTYLREFDEGPGTSEFYLGKWLRDGFFPSDIQDARWRGRAAPTTQPAPKQEARPVTPYTCPKCSALWLHWPAEQSGFGRDTLNCRSTTHCDYCEKGGVEQLQRLERVPAVLAAPQPSPAAQVDRADAVNLARNTLTQHDRAITKKGVRVLAEAVLSMDAALTTPQPVVRKPLTDEQIEKLREATFSTGNPFCPCDSKTMRKAVRAAEHAHGITKGGQNGDPIS